MEEHVSPEKAKERASLSVPECVKRAERYIHENDSCLMLLDVIGSRKLFADQARRQEFLLLIDNLNELFAEYFPENTLTAVDRTEKGFHVILDDGATAGINDSVVIPLVAAFSEEHYPQIPLRYGVARDGYDVQGIALIK